ncbi:hypothetical protein WN48_07416 [Eufriesea mexicana]|uniref:Uncharacterized protein n=1 Tax=Eufriesea mexicana TaxID=516756 RepID=A0A310SUY3_9HYME|nr:hypothetical protein WN48_07416 [Eufriesea mexicana]
MLGQLDSFCVFCFTFFGDNLEMGEDEGWGGLSWFDEFEIHKKGSKFLLRLSKIVTSSDSRESNDVLRSGRTSGVLDESEQFPVESWFNRGTWSEAIISGHLMALRLGEPQRISKHCSRQ